MLCSHSHVISTHTSIASRHVSRPSWTLASASCQVLTCTFMSKLFPYHTPDMCCVSILHWHVSRPLKLKDDGLGNCQVFPYHTTDMCCVSTYKNIALARISTLIRTLASAIVKHLYVLICQVYLHILPPLYSPYIACKGIALVPSFVLHP